MKYFLVIVALLCSTINTNAQTDADTTEVKTWNLKGSAGLNFSQTSLSNWSAGGDNAVAGNAFLNAGLDYKKGHWLWQNTLALEYGLTWTDTNNSQKSTDKIEIGTQIGYTTDNKWYYSAMADFKSQFAKGYNYPNRENYISKFMAPAYSNVSVGIEYKPADKFYSAYFSPLAGKFTFVNDDYLSDLGSFGVDPGDKFRAEFGAYLKGKLEKDIMENVKLMTDANFFTAYDKSFGNVDVEWNLLLNMKINKYLNASLSTTLKYDDDVKYIDSDGNQHGARVQFKEILGVGIGYNF
ncbi:MAG: DUF3078 domain-containing protein [Dysgonomonas sp.]|nr:DUF3078 domain-containing protein [Dysgonomonas sp.]